MERIRKQANGIVNQYIIQILNSQKIKRYLPLLCDRYDLIDDLMQFCLLQLLEKNYNELTNTLQRTNKSIEDYFIGMIINQCKSNTSEFYKTYKNGGFNKNINITHEIEDYTYQETNIEEIIEKEAHTELLLNKIKSVMLRCDPLKIDLFKMKYFEDKTYREVSEYYNIPQESVINKISAVKKTIKTMLCDNKQFSELRKRDHELRRIKLGKIIITPEVKNKIYIRFIKGESKRSLAKEYQISYPLVIKIIKEYGNK